MKRFLLMLAAAVVLMLPVKGDALAQPPECKPWLYCQTLGATINDPGCWCYWNQWRGPGPSPYWWGYRHNHPSWNRGPGWWGPRGGGGWSRDHHDRSKVPNRGGGHDRGRGDHDRGRNR